MATTRDIKERRATTTRPEGCAGKFIGYCRVSTRAREENHYSPEGQVALLHARAALEGIEIIQVVQDTENGAKQRDGLGGVWRRVLAGEAEGLVFLRLDRLGRSLTALATLVDEARLHGCSLLAVDGGWQVRRGEIVSYSLSVLMGVAQTERELTSRLTREGLAAAKSKGVRLGRAPVNTEEEDTVAALRREGLTYQQIATRLNEQGKRTAAGGIYHVSTVQRMLGRTTAEAGHPEPDARSAPVDGWAPDTTPPATDPVAVTEGDKAERGFTLPPGPPNEKSTALRTNLDMSAVQDIIADTGKAAQLLSSIFDEGDEYLQPASPATPSGGTACVRGLDPAHSALLRELLSCPRNTLTESL